MFRYLPPEQRVPMPMAVAPWIVFVYRGLGVKPPFVLVGHSYGGWLVRLYASTYPAAIAGMVLVEAGADNPWRKMPDGKLVRAADLAAARPIPAVKTSNPLRVSDIPPGALSQMKTGAEAKRANPPAHEAAARGAAYAHMGTRSRGNTLPPA